MSIKRVVIVTGASRGIGASIASEFNKKYNTQTHFILFARDLNKLNEVKNDMIDCSPNNCVSLAQIDFSNKSLQVNDYVKYLTTGVPNTENIQELIAIYNHGTLDFGPISDATQDGYLHDKFQTNFYSVWLLLNAIQERFSSVPTQYHININSSYAINPAPSWSVQCCARTSRQMLFRCLAVEKPQYRVLNYVPGVVYTDMLKEYMTISSTSQAQNAFPKTLKDDYESGKFVKAEDTSRHLLKLIEENTFESGSNIEYLSFKLQ